MLRAHVRIKLCVLVVVSMLLAFAPASPASAAAVKVPCDVAALQTAITNANASGGVIQLAGNCIYSVTTPATSSEAFPVIVRSVKIVGGSFSVIRRDPAASSQFRVFTVGANGLLTLQHLNIENGSSSGLGGGVGVTAGELVAEHVKFKNDGASNGGGVSVSAGATAIIRSSSFFGNSATGVGGGAILTFGTLTLLDSSLLFNSAGTNGGGINVQPGGIAKVVRTSIERNRSGGQGGGVSNIGHVTFRDSTIESNTAISGGGGGIGTVNAMTVVLHTTVVKHNHPDNCYPKHMIKGCKN